MSKEGYDRARKILHHQFGRPHIVVRAHINELSAALQSLSRQMLKCELMLSQMGFDADLNNSETLLGLMDRLPPYLQRKWTECAESIFRVGKRPCFSDLTTFVQQSADTANNMFGLHLNEVPVEERILHTKIRVGTQMRVHDEVYVRAYGIIRARTHEVTLARLHKVNIQNTHPHILIRL